MIARLTASAICVAFLFWRRTEEEASAALAAAAELQGRHIGGDLDALLTADGTGQPQDERVGSFSGESRSRFSSSICCWSRCIISLPQPERFSVFMASQREPPSGINNPTEHRLRLGAEVPRTFHRARDFGDGLPEPFD
jgi:hypothetical protein